MAKHCSVLNCDSAPEDGKVFFKFPVNFDMCMQWVQNTGDKDLWQEFEYGGAFPFLEKLVCSDHFMDIDYVVFGNKESGLKGDAVPFTATVKPESLDPVELPTVNAEALFIPIEPTHGKTDKVPVDDSADKLFFLEQLAVLQKGATATPVPNNQEGTLDNVVIKSENMEDLSMEDNTYSDPDYSILTPYTPGRSAVAAKRALERLNETPEQRAARLEKNRERTRARRLAMTEEEKMMQRLQGAERAKLLRANESEEQRLARLERSRLRAKERRQNMSPEEKAFWKERNKLQTRERRLNEDDAKKMFRRYCNALRAAVKRSHETEEQKMERRYKDAKRAAERRSRETPEEREERLRRDRERVQMKRLEHKLTGGHLLKEDGRKVKKTSKLQRTPEMLSILQSMQKHFNQFQGTHDSATPENFVQLITSVQASHPNLEPGLVENAVQVLLTEDNSNQSGGYSNDDQSSHSMTSYGEYSMSNRSLDGLSEKGQSSFENAFSNNDSRNESFTQEEVTNEKLGPLDTSENESINETGNNESQLDVSNASGNNEFISDSVNNGTSKFSSNAVSVAAHEESKEIDCNFSIMEESAHDNVHNNTVEEEPKYSGGSFSTEDDSFSENTGTDLNSSNQNILEFSDNSNFLVQNRLVDEAADKQKTLYPLQTVSQIPEEVSRRFDRVFQM